MRLFEVQKNPPKTQKTKRERKYKLAGCKDK